MANKRIKNKKKSAFRPFLSLLLCAAMTVGLLGTGFAVEASDAAGSSETGVSVSSTAESSAAESSAAESVAAEASAAEADVSGAADSQTVDTISIAASTGEGDSQATVVVTGALPEGTTVTITAVDSQSAEYGSAAAALNDGGYGAEGFLAYDITLWDAQGNAFEPDSTMDVSLSVGAAMLPEDADTDSLTVVHMQEDQTGAIADAVDVIGSNSAAQIGVSDGSVAASFQTDSFSTYTITWYKSGSSSSAVTVNLNYVDASGNSIGTAGSTTISGGATLTISDYAESISGYTYSGAYYNAYNGSTVTSITHSASNNYWYVRNNGTTVSNGTVRYGSTINIYLVYAKAAPSDSITFSYTPESSILGAGNVSQESGKDASYIRYTIVLKNTDGTETYLDSASITGSTYPTTYTFDTNHVTISSAMINQMGISIPGYTFENGYAFFYWSGYFAGDKTKVTDVSNFGQVSDKYSGYPSYLGYRCYFWGSANAAPDSSLKTSTDYTASTLNGLSTTNSLAYNPTGTLRLVFQQVSNTVSYHANYVDAFNHVATPTLVDQDAMTMSWDKTTTTYRGTVTALSTAVPTLDGYYFAGWYKSVDANGNGTGEQAQVDVANGTKFNSDVYYYAKWIKKTSGSGSLTLTKNWVTSSGVSISNANVPFTSVVVDIDEYYTLPAGTEVLIGQYETTLSAADNWTAAVSGISDFSSFRITGEQYYNGSAQVTDTGLLSDWNSGGIGSLSVTRNYGSSTYVTSSEYHSCSELSFTVPATGIVIVKSGSDYYVWSPYETSLTDSDKSAIVAAVDVSYNGNIQFMTTAELKAGGVTVTYNSTDASATLVFAAKSTWSWAAWGKMQYTGSSVTGTVTNTLNTAATKTVTVTKVWNDSSNESGLRPGSVDLKLVNGTLSQDLTLNTSNLTAANTWQTTATVLKYNSDGSTAVYTLSETVPGGYSPSYNQSTLTVTNTLNTVTIYKNLVNSAGSAVNASDDATFLFKLTGDNGATYYMEVTVAKGQSTGSSTLVGMLDGTYTVTELDSINSTFKEWSSSDSTLELKEDQASDSVTAVNTYNYHMQTDTSVAVNKFSYASTVWHWIKTVFF